LNIATNLEWSAFFFPDRPVISEGDSVISYVRLNRKANRVATALIDLKVQPGDHIGIYAPNSGDWIAFYFGVLKAGAVPVTLSSQLSKRASSTSWRDSGHPAVWKRLSAPAGTWI